jgi:hypothetical protein
VMYLHGGDSLLNDCLTSLAWHSSLKCLSSLERLVDVLHCGHMERFTCLENALPGRSVVNLGEHQVLDNMG